MELRTEFVPDTVGAFLNVPDAVYRAAPGISQSELKVLSRSPLDYHRMKLGLIPSVSTHDMEIGTIMHAHVLESTDLPYYIRPEFYGAEKKKWNGNAAECRLWLTTHADKPILTEAEHLEGQKAPKYIMSHPFARPLLQDGYSEVSLFARYPGCGYLIKGRLDRIKLYVAPKGGVGVEIVDFKTAKDASSIAFSYEIKRRRYHSQAAMYRLLCMLLKVEEVKYHFIVYEKGREPKVNVKQLAASAMDQGDVLIDKDMALMRACRMTDTWPEWADSCDRPGFIDLPDSTYSDKSLLTGMTSATTNEDEDEGES